MLFTIRYTEPEGYRYIRREFKTLAAAKTYATKHINKDTRHIYIYPKIEYGCKENFYQMSAYKIVPLDRWL